MATRAQLSIQSTVWYFLEIQFPLAGLTNSTWPYLGWAFSMAHWSPLACSLLPPEVLAQSPTTGVHPGNINKFYSLPEPSSMIKKVNTVQKYIYTARYNIKLFPPFSLVQNASPKPFHLCTYYLCSTEPARASSWKKTLPPGPPSAVLTRAGSTCSRVALVPLLTR